MTIGHFQSTVAATKSIALGVAALSNQASSHFIDTQLVQAGITFHPDGQCYDLGDALGDRAIFVAGEWYPFEPVTNVGRFYEVRCESIFAGTAWDVQPASVGTWVDITSERIWRNTVIIMNAPDISTTTGSFEVGTLGESTAIDTALYTAEASN